MKVNTIALTQELNATANLTLAPPELSAKNQRKTRHTLYMIWVKDLDGKLVARWTLQD